MKTVACYKVVPDVQDLDAFGSGSLEFARAASVLGDYDLVAIEQAVRLAEETNGEAALLSVGGSRLNDTKLAKAALSRGAAKLYRVVDEGFAEADSFQNASAIAAALKNIEFDVVVFGEGSSSQYSQQVGILAARMLGLPVVNAVRSARVEGGSLVCERDLDDAVESVKVSVPCAICMTSEALLPRIPQLKDILAAGKKPVETLDATAVGGIAPSPVTVVERRVAPTAERKCVIYDSADSDAVSKLAADIKSFL